MRKVTFYDAKGRLSQTVRQYCGFAPHCIKKIKHPEIRRRNVAIIVGFSVTLRTK